VAPISSPAALANTRVSPAEPFDCVTMPNLAGAGGYTAMDIPHNTSWEIKK
jgi:hypothetical protein